MPFGEEKELGGYAADPAFADAGNEEYAGVCCDTTLEGKDGCILRRKREEENSDKAGERERGLTGRPGRETTGGWRREKAQPRSKGKKATVNAGGRVSAKLEGGRCETQRAKDTREENRLD